MKKNTHCVFRTPYSGRVASISILRTGSSTHRVGNLPLSLITSAVEDAGHVSGGRWKGGKFTVVDEHQHFVGGLAALVALEELAK